MKVTLAIAGGLAPPLMARQYVVDSAGLDDSQQTALAELVEAVLAEPQREPDRGLRDARSYEVRVDSEAGEKMIVAHDGAVPPRTRQLIEMIKSLARSPS